MNRSVFMVWQRVVRRDFTRRFSSFAYLNQLDAPQQDHAPMDTHLWGSGSKKTQKGVKMKRVYSREVKTLAKPDPIWLRDSCSCALCIDPASKQKLFQTSDIPSDIKVSREETLADGTLKVTWSNDVLGYGNAHVSRYPKDFLEFSDTSQTTVENPVPMSFWNNAMISNSVKFIDFNGYMSQESVLYEALEQLRILGIVFIRGVPASDTAVEDIGSRIGPLSHTFYGRTWDVKSVPQAKNIAYTHQYLGLHMDLLYMRQPPHLQLLHCLKNNCEGGSSLFSDSFLAAAKLFEADPGCFAELRKQKLPYHYENAGQHYKRKHRIIHALSNSPFDVKGVRWSPPFQAPIQLHGGMTNTESVNTFRAHFSAIKAFASLIEAPENIYEYKLQEGECVIFQNTRVLHARRAFDVASGERWLKGAYLDKDVTMSKWRVLDKIHRRF